MVDQVTDNIFQQQNFRLVFNRLPGVVLNCQRIAIPGLECGPAMQNTPYRPMAWEGDQMRDDGPLGIQFKLDENLQAYLEIFKWMKGIRPLDDVIENAIPYEDRRSDITIQLLNSALKANINIIVDAAFPTKLSGFELDATLSDINPVVIDAEFEFDQHHFETL
jgi:hypothetical protein